MEIKIGLVTILTDDIQSMKQFYGETLGFSIIEYLGNYVEFKNPGVRFALCTRETMFEHTGDNSYLQKPSEQNPRLAIPAGKPENVDTLYHDFVSRVPNP